MKVSIFGLGYVGSVSMACLADLGHTVVGVDVNTVKVNMINAGETPVIEAAMADLIATSVKDGRIRAVTEAADAIQTTEVSLICVGTPSASNGSLDLSYVERVCRDIGSALADKDEYHVVTVRSTMLPGSTEELVIPVLEQESGKKAGTDFGVCFNPEFLREGSAVQDFHHPPFTLIGCYQESGDDVLEKLYSGVEAPILKVPLKVAEMVKYANNGFHALKVVFANEIGNICKTQGIDSHQVMDIFCMDKKLNLSSYYLKPGFAFGGSCLPKDLRALLYHARRHDRRVPVLEAILPSNERQVGIGFEMIKRTGKKNVGVLGFSFKAGTDDLRESPLVELIEMLIGKGYHVLVYDENVSLARLHGANRAFIEREIPHIASLMRDSMQDVLDESDVIVIGNKSPEFQKVLDRKQNHQKVIDLVRIAKNANASDASYEGICW
jgi:GDP-mannose 6-dehydrogenase